MSGASSPADAPAVTVGWHCVSEHRRLPVSVGYGQCSAGLAPVERAGPSCEEELAPAVQRPGPLLVTASGSDSGMQDRASASSMPGRFPEWLLANLRLRWWRWTTTYLSS